MTHGTFSDDIRKTLNRTKTATFSIDLPDAKSHGILSPLSPCGTGFFVSGDGWFVTAAHVVTEDDASNRMRKDVNEGRLMKETRLGQPPAICEHLEPKHLDIKNDFALIKVDVQKNLDKAFLGGKSQFPFIDISTRRLEEGEPVYAFGYPLPERRVIRGELFSTVAIERCPRVTSAIVSSTLERSKMIMSAADTQVYVLDKALNFGNSGGPIIATSTGKVHAFCSRFQPVRVPQDHLGKGVDVVIPSLYGIVVSLANSEILHALDAFGVGHSEE